MASVVYPLAKQSFLSQNPSIDMDTDTIRCGFVKTAYTYSAAHQYFSDLGANFIGDGGTARSNGEALGTISVTNGVFDAADVSFAAVSGTEVSYMVVFKDTGVDGTSPLIAYIEITPFTPNGGAVNVTWDSGASKIFAL